MYQAKSGRCRFMDENLGKITWSGRDVHLGCSRSSSRKAMRRPMSWQKQEHSWMNGLWRKQEQKLCSRKERVCTQPCSMRPASTAW